MRMLLLCAVIMAVLCGCGKSNPMAVKMPQTWVEASVANIEKMPPNLQPLAIKEYEFQGQLVYIIQKDGIPSPEDETPIYNNDGQAICSLGGLSCISTCDGEPFFKVAVYKETVWKKS